MDKKIFIETSFDGLHKILDKEKEVIVIIDRKVDEIYGSEFPYRKIIIDTSEEHKTLNVVEDVIKELLFGEVTREVLILGVGGGITTDITGFTASIYKRGVRFAFCPTSLVGQIDASIGGKTGVNFAGYKNIVGVIRQPEFTYICVTSLGTLPKRQFASGLSEMLKTFIIADETSYHTLLLLLDLQRAYSGMRFDQDEKKVFTDLIRRAIEIKCSIVRGDVNDIGDRRKLNFGHTFGHAIEKCYINKIDIVHGEAVTEGMVIAARLSNKLGYLSSTDLHQFEMDISSIGLPLVSHVDLSKLIFSIRNDKKREGNSINFVFIEKIGSVFVKPIAIDELELLVNDLH